MATNDMCENPGPSGGQFVGMRAKRAAIPYKRRVQLQAIAADIALQILEKVNEEERGLFRSMVEDLLPN